MKACVKERKSLQTGRKLQITYVTINLHLKGIKDSKNSIITFLKEAEERILNFLP
jgi:hypothetical protein